MPWPAPARGSTSCSSTRPPPTATPSSSLPSPLHWRARLWRFDGADDLGSAGTASPADGSLTLTLPACSATLAVTLADFGDVPVSHPFYDFVMTVADDGVSAGCGDGSFCPEAAVTRAQMAVFLLKASLGEGYAPPPATGTAFADVPASAFAAAWIEDLAARGITGGCGGGNFCPDAPVTRAQMAVFLLKARARSLVRAARGDRHLRRRPVGLLRRRLDRGPVPPRDHGRLPDIPAPLLPRHRQPSRTDGGVPHQDICSA